MKDIVKFLRDLSANNNREWFNANKARYNEIQDKVNSLAEALIERISEFDPTIRGLTAKDCTYRIYRDVRFSADKSPYKTHIGIFITRGGKKSGFAGYYFHIAGDGAQWFDGHMFGAGDYCHMPEELRIIREDIESGPEFAEIMEQAGKDGFRLDEDLALKRVPRGFDAAGPYSHFLKYKAYCLVRSIPESEMELPIEKIPALWAERARKARPFLDFLNRAIAFSRGEE